MSKPWKESFYDYYIHNKRDEGMSLLLNSYKNPFIKFCRGDFNLDGSNDYLNSLLNDQVWMSNPSKFNDPFDCALNLGEKGIELLILEDLNEIIQIDDFINKINNSFEREAKEKIALINKQIQEKLEETRKQLFVSCFSEYTNITKSVMWGNYANCHKGFCVEYDAHEMQSYEDILLMPILYHNGYEKIYPFFLGQMNKEKFQKITAFTKSEEWKYEKEWRLLNENPDKFGESGYLQKVPKARKVYAGCKSSPELVEKLKEICNKKDIELYQMKMKPNSFELSYEPVST